MRGRREVGVNYGADQGALPGAGPGRLARSAARASSLEAEPTFGGAVQTTVRVTIEIEGGDRPACVADTISRFYF